MAQTATDCPGSGAAATMNGEVGYAPRLPFPWALPATEGPAGHPFFLAAPLGGAPLPCAAPHPTWACRRPPGGDSSEAGSSEPREYLAAPSWRLPAERTPPPCAAHEPCLVEAFKDLCQCQGFFGPCTCCAGPCFSRHDTSLRHFCLSCRRAFCQGCAGAHEGHASVQIRRSSYKDVVNARDLAGLLDVARVQGYVINGKKVVFIHHRPQARPPKGRRPPSYCSACHRQLLDASVAYCSLQCLMVGEHGAAPLCAPPPPSPCPPRPCPSQPPPPAMTTAPPPPATARGPPSRRRAAPTRAGRPAGRTAPGRAGARRQAWQRRAWCGCDPRPTPPRGCRTPPAPPSPRPAAATSPHSAPPPLAPSPLLSRCHCRGWPARVRGRGTSPSASEGC